MINIRAFIQIGTSNAFFLLLYLPDHTSYCQGRKAPSHQLGVQCSRPNKARAFSPTLSLSFIIYRGSVPQQRLPPREQGRSLSAGQWTVELEVAVDSSWRMMSPTSDPGTARHQADSQKVKSEGGWQDGKQRHGPVGSRGTNGTWMESMCVWTFMVLLLKEIHSADKRMSRT